MIIEKIQKRFYKERVKIRTPYIICNDICIIHDIIHGRILQRVIQNVFGVVFAFVFCAMFYLFTSNKKETGVTADAE